MGVDALEHVDEIVVWVDPVQPARRKQTLQDADVLRAEFRPAEQPVLAAHGDRPQGALEMVRVDRHVRLIEEDTELIAAL